ncbi:peptidoglycan DD-metalloendopeptidase family protein [Nigerium sp.]|uniref:peptidoglycan DD-metalloendopeptidase family protein n=1 Tax=Nigerium sp. TaxID=2042655 RepID=UPI003221AE1B
MSATLSKNRFVARLAAFALVAAGAAIAAPVPAEAATVTRVVCKTPSLNVRSGPGTRYAKVGTLSSGARVTGTPSGSWLKIGTSRYIAASYTCTPTTTVAAPRVVSSASVATAPRAGYRMMQPAGTNGSPTSGFGMRNNPVTRANVLHNGVDLGNQAGQPVVAAAGGVVSYAGWTTGGGNSLYVTHGQFGSVSTRYLHLSRFVVKKGQSVRTGQLIGYTGATGSVTKPHLHFSVKVGAGFVDPQGWIGPVAGYARAVRPS